jgi:ribonuclease HI
MQHKYFKPFLFKNAHSWAFSSAKSDCAMRSFLPLAEIFAQRCTISSFLRISCLKYYSTKRTCVYTDGSYIQGKGGKGQGGIGIFFANDAHTGISENYSMWIDPVKFPPTSNRCELLAIYRAFSICVENDICAEIHTDSEYAIKSVVNYAPLWNKNGWYKMDGKPVKNIDLILPLYLIYVKTGNQFIFKHVKAHQNPNVSIHAFGNNIADQYAKMGIYK